MSVYTRYAAAKSVSAKNDSSHHVSLFQTANVWYNALDDSSHDTDHAVTVFENALKIVENSCEIDVNPIALRVATILHDVRDHKAIANGSAVCTEEAMIDLVIAKVPSHAIDVIDAINRSSWSKRANTAIWMETAPAHAVALTKVLQDADWLEAIGEIGIQRCAEYTRNRNPDAPESEIITGVCKHIREKLLLIGDAMNFPWVINRAKELNAPLIEYLRVNAELDIWRP